MRSTFVKVPSLLAPGGGGQHDVGELGGLGQEQVLHDDEQVVPPRILRTRASSGSDTAGFVAEIQSSSIEPCSA